MKTMLSYLSEDKFIMRWIGIQELPLHANLPMVEAYNKKHAGKHVNLEWGIGGLKRKWHRLMILYDSTKSKYNTLFQSVALLTNFLHRRQLDYTTEVLENQNKNRYIDDNGMETMKIISIIVLIKNKITSLLQHSLVVEGPHFCCRNKDNKIICTLIVFSAMW